MDVERIRRCLRMPCGEEVRRLVGGLTLLLGIPRLPLLDQAATFAPLRFLPNEVYGVLLVLLGLALICTSENGRWRTVYGRIVAAAGFVLWSMLAAATISTASALVNVALALVLLNDVRRVRGCDGG